MGRRPSLGLCGGGQQEMGGRRPSRTAVGAGGDNARANLARGRGRPVSRRGPPVLPRGNPSLRPPSDDDGCHSQRTSARRGVPSSSRRWITSSPEERTTAGRGDRLHHCGNQTSETRRDVTSNSLAPRGGRPELRTSLAWRRTASVTGATPFSPPRRPGERPGSLWTRARDRGARSMLHPMRPSEWNEERPLPPANSRDGDESRSSYWFLWYPWSPDPRLHSNSPRLCQFFSAEDDATT